jgi:hypothetical protein
MVKVQVALVVKGIILAPVGQAKAALEAYPQPVSIRVLVKL